MVKQIFECWVNRDKTEISLMSREEAQRNIETDGLTKADLLEYSIEADTWEEACAIHNLRQGWGGYNPMGEPEPCPKCGSWFYPQGSGECWQCGKIC